MQSSGVTFRTSDKSSEPVSYNTQPKGLKQILKSLIEYKKSNLGEIIQHSSDNSSCPYGVNNGFVLSIVRAYNKNHNIVLRPDDFWTAVLTQFSLYVNANAEALRDKFVDFSGKKELVVETIGTLRTVNYGELSKTMSDEIQKNLKDDDVKSWVTPDFSTTTDNDRIVASVVMMASMQKYFDYKFGILCGIPQVTLLGTPDDYVKLRTKIDGLLKYEIEDQNYMEKWHTYLVPIFDELIKASRGNETYDFWTRICHYQDTGSGPTYLSGWISAFCVFNEHGKWQGGKTEIRTWNSRIIKNDWPIVDIDDVSPGYCTVPVKVDDNGTEYDTIMFDGSFATNSINGTTIQPRIDWAIVLKD